VPFRKVSKHDEVRQVQHRMLATALGELVKQLQHQPDDDPTLALQSSLVALASIITWLDSSTVVDAVRGASGEQIARWEQTLDAADRYLEAIRLVMDRELHMSLRERNVLAFVETELACDDGSGEGEGGWPRGNSIERT
jgi:hypothetical protein